MHSTLCSCQSWFMPAFVRRIHPPKCIHLFQQLNISRSNLQLLQSPHASFESLCRFIAGLGLCRNKQPLVYAGLLLLESFGLLANGSIVVVGFGLCFVVVSSSVLKLDCYQPMYAQLWPQTCRCRVTCFLSRSCCSLTFSINESSASKSEDVASRSSM